MQPAEIIFLLNFLLETLLLQHRTRRQLDAFRSCNHKLFHILPTLLHKICKVCTTSRAACDRLAGAACAFFARRLMFVHLVRVRAPPIFFAHYCYAIGSAHIFKYDLVLQHLVFVNDARTMCKIVSLCFAFQLLLLLVQLYQVAG